jgi:uncharacterized repeat protein (TIGR03803 family)
VLYAAAATALPAQTFTTLFSFDGTDGEAPYQAGLVQSTNGDLYGTTCCGAINFSGTVFKITPGGTLTTLYSFCSQSGCTDGDGPQAALVQATNGDLYGTTIVGGAYCASVGGCGTVFKITPGGTLTTLHSFCSQSGCPDGSGPGALIQATNGDFYGVTAFGGANGYGTVFKTTETGTLTTLYSFCAQSGCTDGAGPYAGLLQAPNGDFYGTTEDGGGCAVGPPGQGCGTMFKITPSGTLTTLHIFCSQGGVFCSDGRYPSAVVQAANGDFYGTTDGGGANNGGTVFKITLGGTLTTLYSFCAQSGCTDGESPAAGLVQASDGNFYGTTWVGGADTFGGNDGGTIFKITPGGTLTTLYSFCAQSGCADGENPNSPLVQDTNGHLYGTTVYGGSDACFLGCGTVFSLSVGLGPFVETQTTSDEVGAVVKILGTDLTGATSVSFNGTAAAFTVVSPSLIAATVPAGATSGKVQVVTPSGTLLSNKPFRVLP